jgi:trehalose-6-phosphate synthase
MCGRPYMGEMADAMYRAVTLSEAEAEARHEKHWR